MINYDLQLVNNIVDAYESGNLKVLQNLNTQGFKEGFIQDSKAREIYNYILSFKEEYGEFPAKPTLLRNFESDNFTKPEQGISYTYSKIVERNTFAIIANAVNDAASDLQGLSAKNTTEKLESARKLILDASRRLVLETGKATTSDISKHTAERITAYEERAASGGITGIPTYWPQLTKQTRGYQPGHTYSFIAPTGTGKSFFLILQALHAYDLGYTPLLFTQEMSRLEIATRYDAIKAKVPYGAFLDGKLEPEQYAEFKKHLEALEKRENSLYVNEEAGAHGLDYLIAESEALEDVDIVLVDNVYLFSKSLDYKDLQIMSSKIKTWAKRRNVPIIFCGLQILQSNNQDHVPQLLH